MGHLNRCRYAQFTCIDCNVTFEGMGFQSHTSCISEDQKYQKSVYKAPKVKNQQNQQSQQQTHQLPPHLTSLPTPPTPQVPVPTPTPAPVASTSNGIHPERQRLLDAANGTANKKRAREEPVAVVAPVVAVVAPVVEEKKEKKDKKEKKEKKEKAAKLAAAEAMVEKIEAVVGKEEEVESEAPPAKKSKKELKQEKFAKRGTTVPEAVVVAPVPAPVAEVVSVHPISIHGQQAAHNPPPSFDLSTLSKPYTLPTFLTAIYPTLLGKSTSLASIRDVIVSEAKAAGFNDAAIVEKAFLDGVYVGGASLKKIKTMEMKF